MNKKNQLFLYIFFLLDMHFLVIFIIFIMLLHNSQTVDTAVIVIKWYNLIMYRPCNQINSLL